MSVHEKAARGGLWFAGISFFSQAVSWAFTFYVIRLLEPADYGLMSMAAFMTGYLQVFGGLGLGRAIVQREHVTDGEKSSLFWLSIGFGTVLAVLAFLLAYPTAWLFDDTRVVPVTQLISILFIVSASTTVPYGLMMRDFALKEIATINLIGAVVSSVVAVLMARSGFGVYTLIGSTIVLNATSAGFQYVFCGWRPRLHFSLQEVKPYLSYGIYIALSGASVRLFQSLDRLIIGKFFGATQLGLYSTAMTIASMPIDKVSPIYQQAAFPLFSRLQDSAAEYYKTYLSIARHYLLVISPVLLGSIVVAPELVGVVLGDQWRPMVPIFQVFCGVKLIEALISYRSVLFNATGRHKETFRFQSALVLVMPAAILVAASYSFDAVVLPWIGVYPVVCVAWLIYGLRKAKLAVARYLHALFDGIQGALAMALVLSLIKVLIVGSVADEMARLVILVGGGAVLFLCFLLAFQRHLLKQALRVLRTRQPAEASAV